MARFARWVPLVALLGCVPPDAEADVNAETNVEGATGVEAADSAFDTAVDADVLEGRDCPPDSPLTYDNFGERLMLDHCAGCHGESVPAGARSGAPLEVNLTTHEQVLEWLARVYARSADGNTTMPIVDDMDPADRTRLGDWLACGAP